MSSSWSNVFSGNVSVWCVLEFSLKVRVFFEKQPFLKSLVTEQNIFLQTQTQIHTYLLCSTLIHRQANHPKLNKNKMKEAIIVHFLPNNVNII